MLVRTALTIVIGSLAAVPLCAQPLPLAQPEEVGMSSERLARIDELFQGHLDNGRLAGAVAMVARKGRLVYAERWGMRDMEANDPLEEDDIFGICSMTKPVTSVAVMLLHEEGHFLLTDPVARYLPEFRDIQVARLDEATSEVDIPTEPPRRPMTIQDLLRHTSGLTYGAFGNTVVDQLYRSHGVIAPATLAELVSELGDLPLQYHPGERWNYSLSTDVLARFVEVVSGQSFDVFLEERVFEPLGMSDTRFHVLPPERDRLSALYGHSGPQGQLQRRDGRACGGAETYFSGGGGLTSTAADYMRFAQMLLNGGELEGVRILSPKTVELMTVDHLGGRPNNGILRPGWGFGLGFTVRTVAGLDGMPGSVGEYNWLGIAGTSFWIDPAEELIGVFMVQIQPSRIQFRDQFKTLVYQALIR
jgi:CubicO group peptidase (beta-lactamase class C family)